jgi:hypothetical protein
MLKEILPSKAFESHFHSNDLFVNTPNLFKYDHELAMHSPSPQKYTRV